MSYKYNEQILRMIKNGYSKEEIQHYQMENKKEYTPDFVTFIQEMLKKHKVKRGDISDITGISKDFLYKVLNGAKATNERDYLIAIAVAMGMSLNETQHLLSISNMHAIDRKDLRDMIIWDSLVDRVSFFHVNERLEKANLPHIKTCKDMETYTPNYNSVYDDSSNNIDNTVNRQRKSYTIVNREIASDRSGPAPFDYDYCGTIQVVDEDGNNFYVLGYYSWQGLTCFNVTDEANYNLVFDAQDDANILEQIKYVEQYDTFEDTYNSDFFHYFLEIDRETTKEVQKVLETIDDTKNYTFRAGANMHGNEWCKYCELFDGSNLAKKQYIQIVELGDKTIFSASHESAFMRLELGKLYEIYYGDYEDPYYYIKAESLQEIPNLDIMTKYAFQCALVQMHEYLKEQWDGFVTKSEVELIEDKMELFAIKAALASNKENFEECIEANEECLSYLSELNDEHGVNYTSEIILTLWKLRYCYVQLGQFDIAEKFTDYILAYKDDALVAPAMLSDSGAECIAEVLLEKAHILQSDGQIDEALALTRDTITLLEDKSDSEVICGTLFTAYVKAAYICDETNKAEESDELYDKAHYLVKKHKLERKEGFELKILTFYNNYAWLLWNKLDSEEAIIYYGREIELIEDYLNTNTVDSEELIATLEHCSEALLDIYEETNRQFEAERLRKRVKRIKKY